MEYSPPPLFKQGASARAKLVFFSLIALILLVADSRMRSLDAIRQAVGTALYPLQVVALLPRDAAYAVGGYFSNDTNLQEENPEMRQARAADAVAMQQYQQLERENAHLRGLLEASQRLQVKSVMSEILYDARDAFTRKIVLDRGLQHNVLRGHPVIDESGVVGQVTRVFPFTAEVTLLTDKDQAVPVEVVRNGLRSIAYGQGRTGGLDLRFMPANADIQEGDVLVTSGLDGIYPPGLAVARVTRVETRSNDAFARIVCEPLAGVDRNRQLLILLTGADASPHPKPENPRQDAASGPFAKPAPPTPITAIPATPVKAPASPAAAPASSASSASAGGAR